MGVYDMFSSPPDDDGVVTVVQVKMTNDGQSMPMYNVGDKIAMHDCVIIGYEGYVVIKDGLVILVDSNLHDKWGGLLECSEVIKERNVIAHVLDIKNRMITGGGKPDGTPPDST